MTLSMRNELENRTSRIVIQLDRLCIGPRWGRETIFLR